MAQSNKNSRVPLRQTSKGAGARTRLLDAADQLFYSRGIRNVGIDEVIAVAGVAKASLYKHFPSKDELVAEYLRRRDAEWRIWFSGTVDARTSVPRERLLAVFDVLADWLKDGAFRGCAFQNASIELADCAHPAHGAVTRNKEAMRAYLTDLSRGAGVRESDVLSEQLVLLMEGAVITTLMGGPHTTAASARSAAAVLIQASLSTA